MQLVRHAYALVQATPPYAALGGAALAPLPHGPLYPAFTEFPAGSVEAAQLERAGIQEAEDALIRRRQVHGALRCCLMRRLHCVFGADVLARLNLHVGTGCMRVHCSTRARNTLIVTAGGMLPLSDAAACAARAQLVAELEQRSKAAAFEASALTSQRAQLAALEAQRRDALRVVEERLATATARLDDRAAEERLKQVRLVEEAYQVGAFDGAGCRHVCYDMVGGASS